MEALQHPYTLVRLNRGSGKTVVLEFIHWCKTQEKNRLLWLAVILAGHACIVTPLTLMFVMVSGNSMFFWVLVIAAMTMALVTNLAALPTKITIPVFLLSLVIDIVVIVNCIFALLIAAD
jgi:hypothetical protein